MRGGVGTGRWHLAARRAAAALAVLGCLAASACQQAPPPRSPLFRAASVPFDAPVPRPPANLSAAVLADPDMRDLGVLLDQLMANRAAFAADAGSDRPVLGQLERSFARLGRLGDVVDLYADIVAEQGAGHSALAPRLAVVYTRLGMRDEARALIDPALEGQPDNPDVQLASAYWLVTGFVAGSPERERAREHVRRARELDAEYAGTGLVGLEEIGAQLAP